METAFERDLHPFADREMLDMAEMAGFDVLVTTDQNLRYQQSLVGRQLSILVLMTTDWRAIRRKTHLVIGALANLAAG